MSTTQTPVTAHSISEPGHAAAEPARAKAQGYWGYSRSKGTMTHVTPNGTLIGTGYSGLGSALDDPAAQNESDTGPIPRGTWVIGLSRITSSPTVNI